MLRLKGPKGNEVLLFESSESADLLDAGYLSDGAVLLVSPESADGLIPIFRLRHPLSEDYLYTGTAGENDSAAATYGYVQQGVGFYARHREYVGGEAMRRMTRGSFHRYTVGEEEWAAGLAADWTDERVLLHGL